jgi:tetratricopeptide (TPR) repeat protein
VFSSDPATSAVVASSYFRDSVPSPHPLRSLHLSTCAALLLPLLFTACASKPPAPAPHYAFIPFENLSGDSSLDWVGLGASEYLSRSLRSATLNLAGSTAIPGSVLPTDAIARSSQTLGSRAPGAPGISAAPTAALVAGANRIVTGYIERTAAGVRITAAVEDLTTHKTSSTLSASAKSPLDALNLLARQFSPQAGPPDTANAEAFRLYCTALEESASDAPPVLEKVLALDPGFGRAWVTLARVSAASGDHGRASAVIERSRAQKLAPIDRAWLDYENAALSGDRAASLTAMRQVSELDPGDTGLARKLGDAETAAGNFSQAAAVWKHLTVSSPDDANAWNQLGYSLCWSGDYAGALAAIREYSRLRPNDANSLDSEGDVHYWFGKFAAAAASYSAAYTKTPRFLDGGELYKEAWAKYLAGDKSGADALIAKFRDAREKAKDPSIDLFAADWLFRTGRPQEARALLLDAQKKEAPVSAAGPSATRARIAAQLAVWDLLEGNRAAASKDIADGSTSTATPGELVARFAAMPTASAAEWESRAAHILAAPQLAGLRSVALGYALILDGKKQAAIPVWEEIAKQSSGTDFFARNIFTRLKGQPVEHLSPPDTTNVNQFGAVLDKL